MINRILKKGIGFILAVVVACSMLAGTVFAEETSAVAGNVTDLETSVAGENSTSTEETYQSDVSEDSSKLEKYEDDGTADSGESETNEGGNAADSGESETNEEDSTDDAVVETYKITYVLNGGTNKNNPSSYESNTDPITLKAPTKKGYTFAGWYLDKDFKNKIEKITSDNTGNLKLYAKWKPIKYKVILKGNKSTSGKIVTKTYKYGKTYKLPANKFKRNGYVFTGWNTKANGKGKTYKNKKQIKNLCAKNGGKVVLYAQWKSKGLIIAQKAKSLAWPKSEISKSYYMPTSKFVKAAKRCGIEVTNDCLDFVETCIRDSGVDKTFAKNCSRLVHVVRYLEKSSKWKRIYTTNVAKLKAGDILISADGGGYMNHILLYIGNGKIASGNQNNWYGRIENISSAWWGTGEPFKYEYSTYKVYRMVK